MATSRICSPRRSPRAQGRGPPAERRELLRYANAPIVSQYVAYLARPWTTGDAESTVRAFSCECGDTDCDAVVELTIAAFPRSPLAGNAPVLAEGHG